MLHPNDLPLMCLPIDRSDEAAVIRLEFLQLPHYAPLSSIIKKGMMAPRADDAGPCVIANWKGATDEFNQATEQQ